MTRDDEINSLISEIAKTHGIAVGRDDPIMVLQTINKRLLQDGEKAQQELLNKFKEELEALAQRWSEDAKNKAERIVNASLTASKEAMDSMMTQAALETTKIVKAEIDTSLNRVTGHIRDARRIAYLNIVAASLTILTAAVVVWFVAQH